MTYRNTVLVLFPNLSTSLFILGRFLLWVFTPLAGWSSYSGFKITFKPCIEAFVVFLFEGRTTFWDTVGHNAKGVSVGSGLSASGSEFWSVFDFQPTSWIGGSAISFQFRLKPELVQRLLPVARGFFRLSALSGSIPNSTSFTCRVQIGFKGSYAWVLHLVPDTFKGHLGLFDLMHPFAWWTGFTMHHSEGSYRSVNPQDQGAPFQADCLGFLLQWSQYFPIDLMPVILGSKIRLRATGHAFNTTLWDRCISLRRARIPLADLPQKLPYTTTNPQREKPELGSRLTYPHPQRCNLKASYTKFLQREGIVWTSSGVPGGIRLLPSGRDNFNASPRYLNTCSIWLCCVVLSHTLADWKRLTLPYFCVFASIWSNCHWVSYKSFGATSGVRHNE